MTIEEILKKRKQTKFYDLTNYPNKNEIESIINKTFELTTSKQNLYPYKIHILGPDQKKYKKDFYDIVCYQKGGYPNVNVPTSPYCLIFTLKLIKNIPKVIQDRIKNGHTYALLDSKKYKKHKWEAAIEIGMFAKVLTSLLLEKNIDVSYTGCFPSYDDNKEIWKKLPFIDDTVIFSMQFGYKFGNNIKKKDLEPKPEKNEVINWV